MNCDTIKKQGSAMIERKHPGEITYFDKETGKEWSIPATDLPEATRFHGDVPVVRVVMWASGPVIGLQEYGPNGEALRRSEGFRTPPPEPSHPGTVTYLDQELGTEWTKPAKELPLESRFHGDIPIVKVVFTPGKDMFIQEFGASGELLRSREGRR